MQKSILGVNPNDFLSITNCRKSFLRRLANSKASASFSLGRVVKKMMALLPLSIISAPVTVISESLLDSSAKYSAANFEMRDADFSSLYLVGVFILLPYERSRFQDIS